MEKPVQNAHDLADLAFAGPATIDKVDAEILYHPQTSLALLQIMEIVGEGRLRRVDNLATGLSNAPVCVVLI